MKNPSFRPEAWQLLALIEGDLEEDLANQIRQYLSDNSDWQKEFEAFTELSDQLSRRLRRSAIPTSQELGEYVLGLVSPQRKLEIELYLAKDPDRRQEVDDLNAYLSRLDPLTDEMEADLDVTQPGSDLQVFLLSLLDNVMGGHGMPSMASVNVRGGRGEQHIYQAGDVQFIVAVQKDESSPEGRTLSGLVLGLENIETYTVSLFRGDQLIAEVGVDLHGNFAVYSLEAASYRVILYNAQTEYVIQEISLS